ncbi:hypothetical protein FRC09_000859 [Ceratobasidium sp. 395]|nr:hypothetical protein FRC09_000859 [Ceratobasidium sp. 395]
MYVGANTFVKLDYSTTTIRSLSFTSQDGSSILYHCFLLILVLIFIAAYIYVIRPCLRRPHVDDASGFGALRVAPGRNLTVSKSSDESAFRDRTALLEETTNAASTSSENISPQHRCAVRSPIVQAVTLLAVDHTKSQGEDESRRDASCSPGFKYDYLDSAHEDGHELSPEGVIAAETLIEDQDSYRVPCVSKPNDETVTGRTGTTTILNRCAPLVQVPDLVEPDPTSFPRRASSTPVSIIDPSRCTSEVPQYGETRPALRGASLPTVRDNNHDPIAIFTPLTTKPIPLKQTLYVGSKDLTRITTLDILVVPNGHCGEIKDPEIDAKYLCKQFGALGNVNVQRIPEHEVTLDQVNEAITARWKVALPGACLLVFLSGHGCDNAMELRDNHRIDESHLNSLFQTLRRTNPKPLRVAVIFDICRDNKEKEAVEMHNVSLIWSCSPGQKTWGFGFETLHEPSSTLLLGLLLAAHTTYQSSGVFEEQFKTQVTRFARFNNHVTHVAQCNDCKRPNLCSEAFVMRKDFEQNADLRQSQGFLNDLYSFLVEQEQFRDLSKTVYEFMFKNNTFLRSNDLPISENPVQATDN